MFDMIDDNLSGIDMLKRLRKGHVVRRTCWLDGILIRICNETGYDKIGHVTYDDRHTALYTLCTTGLFLHLGWSAQPFRKPYMHNYMGYQMILTRQGEGIGMLFANDWEDYGFISLEDFRSYTAKHKTEIRARKKDVYERATTEANEEK